MLSAVIVTYNRKKLLCENIKMLLHQTIDFDKIFIIDNCSTDGTYEWLKEKNWLDNDKIIYVKTESNMGGAGGFFIGTKTAYEAGADWIVLMDDDGKASDEHTFEILMKTAGQLYDSGLGNKKLFVNCLVQKDDMLSFKIDDIYTVQGAVDIAENGIIANAANPFNGTAVSRELVEAIGYPNKDFFIKGDEVDYKNRSYEVDAYVATVVDARYIHPRPETIEKKVFGKKVPFFVESPWKEYYAARNFTYMYKRKKQYKGILFELFFVKTLAILSFKCKKFKTLKMLIKGINHGWKGKLGATITP